MENTEKPSSPQKSPAKDDTEPIDASEPIDTSPITVVKPVRRSPPPENGRKRRRVKKNRRRTGRSVFRSRDTEVSASPTPDSLPQKPKWMPEEMWKKQVESVEVYAAPQEVEGLRVERRNDSRRNESRRHVPVHTAAAPQVVRNFYNDQTYRSRREKRTESKIYKLRSFNNCIKYMLINKYATAGGNVLDLGCGKGGDLAKWQMARISSFVGIDLSDASIKEAVRRYKRSHLDFAAVFATGDCFRTPVPEIVKDFDANLEFDTVSMQFCLHYAFASEETARMAIENVARSLKLGGMFIGTIPSSDFIRWKIKKLPEGEKKWGNSLYEVEFPTPPPKDGTFAQPFGNVYTYYLVDAVDHVPEYVVPFEKLRSLCEEYNLELRYKKNLFDVFNKEIPQYFRMLPPPLVESLKRENGSYGVSGEDRDACSFYLAFAFEKTS